MQGWRAESIFISISTSHDLTVDVSCRAHQKSASQSRGALNIHRSKKSILFSVVVLWSILVQRLIPVQATEEVASDLQW